MCTYMYEYESTYGVDVASSSSRSGAATSALRRTRRHGSCRGWPLACLIVSRQLLLLLLLQLLLLVVQLRDVSSDVMRRHVTKCRRARSVVDCRRGHEHRSVARL